MRVGVAQVIISLAAVGLAGCATVAEPVNVQAPAWQPGFSWSYTVERAFDYAYEEDGESGNESGQDTYRIVREVANTTQRIDGERVYLAVEQTDGEPDTSRVAAFRQRDLARVYAWLSPVVECDLFSCDAIQYSLDGAASTEAYPELFRFPMRTGDEWVEEVGCEGDCPGIQYTVRVGGGALVDTPVGKIHAARITTSYELVDKEAYKRAIIEQASAQGFEVHAYELDGRYEKVLYYSEDYQAVVLSQETSYESERVHATSPDGEDIRFSSRGQETERRVLDGARLVPREEQSLVRLVEMFDTPLRDPSGAAVAGAGYTIAVSPSQLVINAAEPQNVSFDADLKGVDALPDGHSLRWRLVDVSDREIATGDGLRFAPTIDDAGLYRVELEARADGDVVSSAGGRLIADWHQQLSLDCPDPVAFGLPDDCDAVDIPVYPGVRSLSVVAAYDGPATMLRSGGMRVYDDSGDYEFAPSNNGGHAFYLDDFSGHENDETPWRIEVYRSIAALETVTLSIDVAYSEVMPEERSVGMWRPGAWMAGRLA